MGTRLFEGRFFDPAQDREGGRSVPIVDDLLAQSTWPGESAVGKVIIASHTTPNGFEDDSTMVVGVVGHAKATLSLTPSAARFSSPAYKAAQPSDLHAAHRRSAALPCSWGVAPSCASAIGISR